MKIEVILGRIFMALVSAAAAFLLLDYASRWFLPESSSPVEREYNVGELRKPKPYVMFGGTPGARYFASEGERLNGLGYRGREPAPRKPPGEFRVFMLGGSTVLFGNPPLAVLLEEEFRQGGAEGVRVYNFGVISSVSGMELARILFEIADMEPDLVIMYNGGNDIYQPLFWDPRPGYPYNFLVYDSNPLVERDVERYPAAALFAYGSNILRYLFPSYFVERFVSLAELRREAGFMGVRWQSEVARTYVENVVKAAAVSKAFGAEFIAFFQPLVYYKDRLSKVEEVMSRGGERAYFLDIRERVRSEMAAAMRKSGVTMVDLSDIFDDVPERVFNDIIHIRQEYYGTVAGEIYRNITRYMDLGGLEKDAVPSGGG